MIHCRHDQVEPVELITGEVVGQVCSDCLAELPAAWGCPDCDYVDLLTLCSTETSRVMGQPCIRHAKVDA